MPRRPARFTQSDVARALRAAGQVGARVAVEIDMDGTIRLVPIDPEDRRLRRPNGTVETAREIVL